MALINTESQGFTHRPVGLCSIVLENIKNIPMVNRGFGSIQD